jgi:D-alanine--poly(phosphoribitol) ligase subunit 2
LRNHPRDLLKIDQQRVQLDRDTIKAAIRSKLIELAKALNIDAAALGDADIIPAAGYLDSSAILELIVWYEQAYDFPLRQEDINIDNLGSIDAMTDFLLARKSG